MLTHEMECLLSIQTGPRYMLSSEGDGNNHPCRWDHEAGYYVYCLLFGIMKLDIMLTVCCLGL